jgi:thioredoxin reductase
MKQTRRDPGSTGDKPLPVREHAQLLVVGAGPAGLAAAIEAAGRGAQVVLVDEHPVDHALMGLDIPFHFGQRMNGAVRNRERMIERIAEADPRIAEAFEAGVDVRLGVAVWGLFSHRPGLRWVKSHVAGLTEGSDSWLMSFDAVILATGRRDIGLAFPGWDLPGVMGVTAAETLLTRYDAFDGQRLVILGSGAEATGFASAARAAGREVAAIVEVSDRALDAEGCRALATAGVPILLDAMVAQAFGGADGVERVGIKALGAVGTDTEIVCDTLVLAIGACPTIELFDVAGTEIVFDGLRGGHVPVIERSGRTSMPGVFGAGDCIGIDPRKSSDAGIAAGEGVRAAAAACQELGLGRYDSAAVEAAAPEGGVDVAIVRAAWAAAAMAVSQADTPVCQCEDVSLPDLLGVRPPRYLDRDQPAMLRRDLETLAAGGLVNQDQIKRLTRAGMGTCQGRRCREQVGAIVACATKTPLSAIPLPSYRAPVRPLPLSVFADTGEAAEIAEHWEGWFGIKSQWVPFWEPIPPVAEREDAK